MTPSLRLQITGSLFLLILLPSLIFSQVYLEENFDTPGWPTGWTILNADGATPNSAVSYINNAWVKRIDFAPETPQDSIMVSTSWYTPADTAEDYLITPQIMLGPSTLVSWEARSPDASFPDGFELRISTTTPDEAGFMAHPALLSVSAGPQNWTAYSLNLNNHGFSNQTVYLAWKNNSFDRFLLHIDEVKIMENPTSDLEVSQVHDMGEYSRYPLSQFREMAVGALLSNNGSDSLTNIQLVAKVYRDSNLVFTDSAAVNSIPAFGNIMVTLPDYLPVYSGKYHIDYQAFASVMDEDSSNNFLSSRVMIISDSAIARDDNMQTGALSIGSGISGQIGQNMHIERETILSSISIYLTNANNSMTGSPVSVWVYDLDSIPTNLLSVSDTVIVPQNGGQWVTIPMKQGGFLLQPGEYALMVQEGDSTLTLGTTEEIYTPNTTWVDFPGNPYGGFTTLEKFGFQIAFMIRANLAPSCKLQIDSLQTNLPLCYGDSTGNASVAYSGAGGFATFQWSTGDSSQLIQDLPAGEYFLQLTDAAGCLDSVSFALTQPDEISWNLDSIRPGSCKEGNDGGIFLTVEGGTGAFLFEWLHGDSVRNPQNLAPGAYSAIITDGNQCAVATDIIEIGYLDSIPEADFSYEIQGGSVIFTNLSTGGNTFSWTFGDASGISSDPEPVHTFTGNGSYVVSLTATNDCGSHTFADTILMETVGINRLLQTQTVIYPNPSQGEFYVEFREVNLESVEISVYDLIGQKIYHEKIGPVKNSSKHRIGGPLVLPRGVYLLEVMTDQGSVTERIMIE